MSARDLTRPAFELSGGDLALDFANSWSDRADPGSDKLSSYEALAAWMHQAGLLPEAEAETCLDRAAARPEEAADALAAAKALREALFALFAGAARRERPRSRPAELATLDGWLARSLAGRALHAASDGFAWGWRAEPEDADPLTTPLRAVALAAAELLTSDRLVRVRECDAPNCSWLFLDRSRAGSRRWCSMESCGNRAKARRHYRRRASAG